MKRLVQNELPALKILKLNIRRTAAAHNQSECASFHVHGRGSVRDMRSSLDALCFQAAFPKKSPRRTLSELDFKFSPDPLYQGLRGHSPVACSSGARAGGADALKPIV